MRKPEILSPSDKGMVTKNRKALESATGMVGFDYTKADGTPRSMYGRVEAVKGEGDKAVVIMETSEGFRSANLSRIRKVRL